MNAGQPKTLYSTPSGEVFIRRDGSVHGPMKIREILEWSRLVCIGLSGGEGKQWHAELPTLLQFAEDFLV